MDETTSQFLETLRHYSLGTTVCYFTLDPERALGIHDVLFDYRVICPRVSTTTQELEDSGAHVLILERILEPDRLSHVERLGSYGILCEEASQRFIIEAERRNPAALIVTLKNTESIAGKTRELGWKLIGPDPAIAALFEEKLSQFDRLSLKVPFPATTVARLDVFDAAKIKFPAVLQFNRGHSGNSTIRIEDLTQFEQLQKVFPRREVKLSEFIIGTPYTLNGLVLRDGRVMHGSISRQLTGLPEATANPNATVGNDFGSARTELSDVQSRQINEILEVVGAEMYDCGYHGMFGIDIIVASASQQVFFIEVNTHQPASISFEALLHRRLGVLPIIAAFLADELGVTLPENLIRSVPLLMPGHPKQILYRNKSHNIISNSDLTVPTAPVGAKLIVSSRSNIETNGELYRLQWFS